MYVLENSAPIALAVPAVGVLFSWDSPPIIDDPPGSFTKLNPTDIQCTRAGRYAVHYAVAGAFGPADPPAYFASQVLVNALGINPSLCQFDVQGMPLVSNQAVTLHMFFVLPALAVGDLVQLLLAAWPAVPGYSAGAGAYFAFERKG